MDFRGRTQTWFLRSALHRPFLDTRSAVQAGRVARAGGGDRPRVLCVSPYRSGTTTASKLFPDLSSSQEPLHYLTLHHLQDWQFLQNRRRFLNLDMEASGFFSGVAEELMQRWDTDRFFMFIRPPQDWVQSLVNFFGTGGDRYRVPYVDTLFFGRFTGWRPCDYPHMAVNDRQRAVDAWLEFYARVYSAGLAAPNCRVYSLQHLDQQIEDLTAFVGASEVVGPLPRARPFSGSPLETDQQPGPSLERATAVYERALSSSVSR